MYKIAIIEDDNSLKNTLKEYFLNSTQIECVLAVDSIDKFLKYGGSSTVQLLLLDVNLHQTLSFYSIPKLLLFKPDMEIIMHTVYDDSNLIFQSLTYGATGYQLKDLTMEELEAQLLVQLSGQGALLSPAVSRKIIEHFAAKSLVRPDANEKLNEKESVVAHMLRDGYSYEVISQRLGISINGVRYYVKSIYKKLQINSRGELLRVVVS